MHFPPVRDIVRRYSLWLPLADTARRSSPRLAQAVIVRRSPPWLPLADTPVVHRPGCGWPLRENRTAFWRRAGLAPTPLSLCAHARTPPPGTP